MTPYIQDADFTLYVGDVRQVLADLPEDSVDCCVTSPPYWGLRDYGTAEWEGGDPNCDHKQGRDGSGRADGVVGDRGQRNRDGAMALTRKVCRCGATRIDRQIGLEPTPDEYVASLVQVFREVRRVLADHGTLWLNLGSSYFSGESYPLSKTDAVWLAAIIDGEGCIQIHQQRRPPEENCVDSFQVDVGVGMMTPEVVQKCHEITGLGSAKKNARGVWDWSVRGQQAAQMLRAIYPYLLTKKRQAAYAIMLADDLATRKYGRGNPADPDVVAWRGEIRKAISELNQWREPTLPVVPPRPIALNLKPKDDVGIPHAVYNALRDDGWYARSDIVWSKPNPSPSR